MLKFLLFLSILSTLSYADDREKVLILDTGIARSYGVNPAYLCNPKDIESEELKDYHGHGSNVYGLITKDLDVTKYCVVIVNMFDSKTECKDNYCAKMMAKAFDILKKDSKIKYLNLSIVGDLEIEIEKNMIKEILDRGGYVTAAAGNDGKNLDFECQRFPACYRAYMKNDHLRIVGNTNEATNFSLTTDIVTDIVPGVRVGNPSSTGTSQSSAIKMNRILRNIE